MRFTHKGFAISPTAFTPRGDTVRDVILGRRLYSVDFTSTIPETSTVPTSRRPFPCRVG